MLEKIQFLLSMQIIGLCILGGIMMLLRSFGNRARHILGWSMIMWALMAVIRNIVNFYLHEAKEAFHPDVLIASCFVVACLAAYVIEKLRPGYLTFKRFSIFLSPVLIGGFSYLTYRLSGGEIHVYYSMKDVFAFFNLDVFLRLLVFALTVFYMALPVYLVMKYGKEYTDYLSENVSDPENYDLIWLKRTMVILSMLYVLYLILLLTDAPLLYVVDKAVLLVVWFYFFYKTLFLKNIQLDRTFKDGWNSPVDENDEEEDDDEQQGFLFKRYAEEVNTWFEKEKPYLRDDLRLTDLQRVFPISRSYLSQLFNKELGMSFSDYVNQFRVEESKRLMDAEPLASIQEIAERSGFHSISTFRRSFIKQTGIVPSEYKRG
ncbi:AraC family transcriptional regulator [Parabacteroides sp. AM58-2XD]|jgi:AraC-like DNA-binding protein|uniref:Helix-turn-helix transcriptional regulator n=1 Tax=Parabacteroides segnis TaxID=2763058 RepID=A0ABR7DVE8_9BACT|nr:MULTISPECIES: helix-turn-helix domain-containing protein [Parabacteroides]MBC5641456.1 helix-turn-helix transcriptional regulator [Parabacteroides segnis]MCM0711204.1 helix-turn-helix domain-containing protein [Parabacteroides sp. TA-V-105]RGY94995.1 AraC family transcriptional regulator [Parabacteroides sp. AM58-2XD]